MNGVQGGDAAKGAAPHYVRLEDRGVGYELYLPDPEDYIQKLIRDNGKPYELDMLHDMCLWLGEESLVVDAGANVGNHAVYLAAVTGAHVVAFEPNALLAEHLRKSIVRNGLESRLDVREQGLGRIHACARFKEQLPENRGAQALETGSGDMEVVRLDDILLSRPVTMLKVDVEGMEMDVLEGARKTILRDRPLIYIESQDEASFKRLAAWAAANDYGYWESFNITPTHLFRPIGSFTLDQRLERLASREVLQEYRYNVQLRRARRFQRAAEDRVAVLQNELSQARQALASTQNGLSRLTQTLDGAQAELKLGKVELERARVHNGEITQKCDRLAAEGTERLRRLKAVEQKLQASAARLREIEEGTVFRFSWALVDALTSGRGLVAFPVRFARLVKQGISRRISRLNGRTSAVTNIVPAAAVQGPTTDFVPSLIKWAERKPLALKAVSVLYADISLNAIDGSSIWYSSIASILCEQGPCILVSKEPIRRDVIVSNIRNAHNLVILEPGDIDGFSSFSIANGAKAVRALDCIVPGLRVVVVRGLAVADELLKDRQFHGRLNAYVTDFFSISEGNRLTSEKQASKIRSVVSHAAALLVQTDGLRKDIARIAGRDFNAIPMPPTIPDGLARVAPSVAHRNAIRIGYAGKVNSRWGIIELLDWADQLSKRGIAIELHIVADKISNGPDPGYENLAEVLRGRMSTLGARHYTGYNREASMELMSTMDFVWCFRPSRLEDCTVELSTKLVEMVGMGARCLCYPNQINRETLGEDYPFFLREADDLARLLESDDWGRVPEATVERVRDKHEISQVGQTVRTALFAQTDAAGPGRTILFAGHDFKFIDAYISRLKSSGVQVLRDVWEWGEPRSFETTRWMANAADVVFCEWGLANAVWYSRNLKEGQSLHVRIHAQEVREKAMKFGRSIDATRVSSFIFVSPDIRQRALELFGWNAMQTRVLPNFVLDEEYQFVPREPGERVTLGMVGIVPRLKRFDRAVDVLAALVASGVDARLRIKGHRPEELAFMQAPGRKAELEYYEQIYQRIEAEPNLRGRVEFDAWGNDVAAWYRTIDFILSCSDSESFHYALADGVLAGCLPLVWPWPGAASTYDARWIVHSTEAAVEKVMELLNAGVDDIGQQAVSNRELVASRYGAAVVFQALDTLLLPGQST